jgi:aspartyl-tRNA(Asn)/glutamyl-tRNA(Gln) amidotransferase subunit A
MTNQMTAVELAKAIASGDKTAVSVVEDCLNLIHQTDTALHAFNTLTPERALETALKVDTAVRAGETLPFLAGVPIALKDNIHVAGVKTTCSSRILENFIAPFNATVTEKLNAHWMPIMGKTNCDEFAMGSSTENSAFGHTKNPWDLTRVPGGSSGGSAATVSAGQVPLSLGSDTGGSVRQPAALCGLVGLKPTYGTVSRYGLVAFGSSLDQISPFTSNVEDCAALFDIISGLDPRDSSSLETLTPACYPQVTQGPAALKIGYVQELMEAGLDPDVKASFEQAIETFKTMGATVEAISLPHAKYGIAAYYIIATAEASSNLARYDGVRYGVREENVKDLMQLYIKTRAKGFGPEVKRRIMLGTFALSSGYYDAYYGKAQQARQLIKQDFEHAFSQVDLLIGPTSPSTAFKLGEKSNDPVQMYLADIATIPVNLAGIPAMSIPCGFDTLGLPIGLQLYGPHLSELKLLQVAYQFQEKTGLKNLSPKALAALNSYSLSHNE